MVYVLVLRFWSCWQRSVSLLWNVTQNFLGNVYCPFRGTYCLVFGVNQTWVTGLRETVNMYWSSHSRTHLFSLNLFRICLCHSFYTTGFQPLRLRVFSIGENGNVALNEIWYGPMLAVCAPTLFVQRWWGWLVLRCPCSNTTSGAKAFVGFLFCSLNFRCQFQMSLLTRQCRTRCTIRTFNSLLATDSVRLVTVKIFKVHF